MTRPRRCPTCLFTGPPQFAPGDRILTARTEYAGNVIAFLQVVEVVPSKVGLGVAIDYALGWGLGARVQTLATALRSGLHAIPGVTVRDTGAEQCGIITFTADGVGERET